MVGSFGLATACCPAIERHDDIDPVHLPGAGQITRGMQVADPSVLRFVRVAEIGDPVRGGKKTAVHFCKRRAQHLQPVSHSRPTPGRGLWGQPKKTGSDISGLGRAEMILVWHSPTFAS